MKDPFGNSEFQEPVGKKYNRTAVAISASQTSPDDQSKIKEGRLEVNARHIKETHEIANDAPMPSLRDQISQQALQFRSKINSINCPEQEDGSAVATPSKRDVNRNGDPRDGKAFENRNKTTLKRNTKTAYLKKGARIGPSKISHFAECSRENTGKATATRRGKEEKSQSSSAPRRIQKEIILAEEKCCWGVHEEAHEFKL